MNEIDVTSIKPAPGYVIVEQTKLGEGKKNLYIPNADENVPQWGKVIRVGESVLHQSGTGYVDCIAKVGDMVVFKRWAGNETKVGSSKYQFLKFDELIGVVA